jgi:predicted NAD/FAD-binding protein
MTLELGNGQVLNGFAHVVFATQANSAARVVQMYKNDMETESIMAAYEAQKMNQALAALDAFKYVRNLVVNHSDMRLLPPVEADRRELNLVSWDLSSSSSVLEKKKTPAEMESDLQVSPAFTMATHILACPDGAEAVYQTTNPTVPIAPSTIRSVARMERAVLTLQSKAARASFIVTDMNGASRLGSTQGVRATPGGPQLWFCGSYAGAGIPLLEGCVVSAQVVVEHGIFRSERVSARTEPW